MLIIAIPKSASTSLMATLGSLHNIPYQQLMNLVNAYKIPSQCKVLSNVHSDIIEYNINLISRFITSNKIYKQHIFPSKNNLKLLENVKAIILLRDPSDIIKAYRRGALIHNSAIGLRKNLSKNILKNTEDKWIEETYKLGLYDDLVFFYETYKKFCGNKLIIYKDDLINNPTETINKIESYFNLPLSKNVVLKEKRITFKKSNNIKKKDVPI